MPPYRFDPYQSPYAGSLADLILRQGDAPAGALMAGANANARAAQTKGAAWANAAQNIGGAVAAIPQQMQQQQAQTQERERAGLEIQQMRDTQARLKAWDAALSEQGRDAAIASLKQSGQAGQIPALEKVYAEADARAEAIKKLRAETRQREADYLGDLGLKIKASGYDPAFALGAAHHARSVYEDEPEIQKQIDALRIQIIEDPASVKQIADSAIAGSSYRDALNPPKPMLVGPESALVDPTTGRPIYQAPPKVEKPEKIGTRSVDTIENGRRVTKIVPDVAGGSYPTPPPAASPDNEPLVQVMGPAGTPIWVKRSDAVGKPAAQAPRAVTGQERQSLAYYNRAKEAVETLTTGSDNVPSLEHRIANQGTANQYRLRYAPNIAQTEDQQSYRQAQRAFTEARLRKESGAAIPTAEYENDARTYFAQPGDSKATIQQKRKARDTVLEGLKFGAGRAYDEFYGEPNQRPAVAPSKIDVEWGRDKNGKPVRKGGG